MEAMFYGFDTKSLRKLAFQIADINKIQNRFSKEKQEAGNGSLVFLEDIQRFPSAPHRLRL